MNEANTSGSRDETSSVRLAETEDGAVLLDLDRRVCISLTPVAVKIWHMLSQRCTVAQIANRLADECPDVSRERIKGDVEKFVADVEQKGLMRSDRARRSHSLAERVLAALQHARNRRQKEISPSRRTPELLTFKAFLGLLAFDLFAFGPNFTRTNAFVRSWKTAPNLPAVETVNLICQAVNYACVWYPKRVLCLQRSAVTTCLLRSCGIPAKMVIGAQKLPFKAHAWTEVGDLAINERRDVRRFYLVWERC